LDTRTNLYIQLFHHTTEMQDLFWQVSLAWVSLTRTPTPADHWPNFWQNPPYGYASGLTLLIFIPGGRSLRSRRCALLGQQPPPLPHPQPAWIYCFIAIEVPMYYTFWYADRLRPRHSNSPFIAFSVSQSINQSIFVHYIVVRPQPL